MAEFAHHGWDANDVPDPQDPQTFTRSKLDWREADVGEHALLRDVYQHLITLRHTEPDLADPWLEHLSVDYDEDEQWLVMRRGALSIACNIGSGRATVPVGGEVVLAWGEPTVQGSQTMLPGHSFAILRTA